MLTTLPNIVQARRPWLLLPSVGVTQVVSVIVNKGLTQGGIIKNAKWRKAVSSQGWHRVARWFQKIVRVRFNCFRFLSPLWIYDLRKFTWAITFTQLHFYYDMETENKKNQVTNSSSLLLLFYIPLSVQVPRPTPPISALFFVSFLPTSSTSFPRCIEQITTPAWPFLSHCSLPRSAVLGLWLMTSTLHWTADYIELVVEQHIETTHTSAYTSTHTQKPQTA